MKNTNPRTKGKTEPAKRRRAARRPASTTVVVTFRHVDPSDALRKYAERKFAHLGKFLKRACEAHVILTVDKYRQCGEVTVKSGRLSATAEQESKDLYSASGENSDQQGAHPFRRRDSQRSRGELGVRQPPAHLKSIIR